MRTKLLLASLLVTAATIPAMAQSNPPARPAAPAATMTAPAPAAVTTSNAWRSSKLIGVNVYNDQNEKLGDINDIILDKSGKVEGLILGVGGFLGMGEHLVEVTMDKLKFTDQPVKSTATTGASTTSSTASSSNTTSSGKKWYPDHAVLNATKDQLKAMPQFKY